MLRKHQSMLRVLGSFRLHDPEVVTGSGHSRGHSPHGGFFMFVSAVIPSISFGKPGGHFCRCVAINIRFCIALAQ